MKVPFKTINDTPIWLTEDGKFTARINGKDVTKPQISQIEKLITATLGAITAYKVNGYEARPIRKVSVLGFERDRARTKDEGLLGRHEHLYVLSDEQVAQLEDIAKRKRAIEEEWQQATYTLTRLTSSNIDDVRKIKK